MNCVSLVEQRALVPILLPGWRNAVVVVAFPRSEK
jgi:hypothetical protein